MGSFRAVRTCLFIWLLLLRSLLVCVINFKNEFLHAMHGGVATSDDDYRDAEMRIL